MKRQTMKRAPGATYQKRVPLMIKARGETRKALRTLAERDDKTLSFYVSTVLDRHVATQARKARRSEKQA